MSFKIFKYAVSLTQNVVHEIPNAFKPCHVGIDPTGQLCVWCSVDTRRQPTRTVFHAFGTGHQMDGQWIYCGTVIDGDAVWHVHCGRAP